MAAKREAQKENVELLRAALEYADSRLKDTGRGTESYAWAYGYLSSAVSRLLKDHPADEAAP